LDLLASPRGLKQLASPRRIVVLRCNGNEMKGAPFSYSKAVTSDRDKFHLEPNDIVRVL